MSNGSSRFGAAVPLLMVMRACIVVLAGWPGWVIISRSITDELGPHLTATDPGTLDFLTLSQALSEGLQAFPAVAGVSLAAALVLDQMLAVAAVRSATPAADGRVWSAFWQDGPAWLVPLLKLALLGALTAAGAAVLVHLAAQQVATYGEREGWTFLAFVGGVRGAQGALTGLLMAIIGAKFFWLRTAMLVSGRRALWRNLWHAPKWLWVSKGAVTALGLMIWLLQLAGLALLALMRPGHATATHWALWGLWILISVVVWVVAIRSSTRRYVDRARAAAAPAPRAMERTVAPELLPMNVPTTNPVEVALPPEPGA